MRIHSRRDEFGEWTLHATGLLAGDVPPIDFDGTAWPPADAESIDVSRFYADYAEGGFAYGPVFQGLKAAWRTPTEAYLEVELPEGGGEAADFAVHPALLDAALQGLLFVSEGGARVPFSWDRVALRAVGAQRLRVRIAATGENVVSLAAADSSGEPVLSAQGVVMREVSRDRLTTADPLLELTWQAYEPVAGPETGVVTLRVDGGDPLTETSRVLAALQDHLASDTDDRLVVLTRGAVALDDGASVGAQPIDVAGAAVWGLLRSAANEQPGRVAVIDADEESADVLADVIASGVPQAAVRSGRAFTPQLSRVAERPALPDGEWRAVHDDSGSLDRITTVRAEPRALEAGEVRVSMRATGLNFRDVLTVLGMYPGEPSPLGLEGSGVVTEVGADVDGFALGDRVLGMFPAALATTAVADARMLAKIPDGTSFADAASIPIAYLSAYYALRDLAGLASGERVLVHAAAGGVGMAAVQLAKHWGAEVVGTASPAKHGALRDLGLTDDRIASSRTVRSSRTGSSRWTSCWTPSPASSSTRRCGCWPSGGRFIELGKTDIREPAGTRRALPRVRPGRGRARAYGRDARRHHGPAARRERRRAADHRPARTRAAGGVPAHGRGPPRRQGRHHRPAPAGRAPGAGHRRHRRHRLTARPAPGDHPRRTRPGAGQPARRGEEARRRAGRAERARPGVRRRRDRPGRARRDRSRRSVSCPRSSTPQVWSTTGPSPG